MLDHFGKSFNKVGIVETYGVLENQGSVFYQYAWTQPIIERINRANDPFYSMFKILVTNWNRYKLNKQLKETAELLGGRFQAQFLSLSSEWNQGLFAKLMAELACMRHEELERHLSFIEKVNPCAGLQFTLSDVILALALIDPCFTASPVKVNVNDKGFLQTACDPKSNVYYYDRKDYQKFVEILLMRVKI